MRVSVLKIGSRISIGGTSGGSGEANSIIKMLRDGNLDVMAFTKISKKDTFIDGVTYFDIESNYEKAHEADILVVINGNINFFGGAEDKSQLLNYKIINSFQGKVVYVLCDPNLVLKQVWPSVQKKEWAGNWTEKDLLITRDDIIYFSQPHDLMAVGKLIKSTGINVSKIIHFKFYLFPLMNDRSEFNENRVVDLIYGGTFRTGKREQSLIRYYFGYPEYISVEVFGKIREKDFNLKHTPLSLSRPSFTKAVEYYSFNDKMMTGLSTVTIGDKWYHGRDLTQRIYESISSNVVTFIDNEFDPDHLVFRGSRLEKFLYVNDRSDVISRIMKIKSNIDLLKEFTDEQYDFVTKDFNWLNYCGEFSSLVVSC